LRSRPRPGPGRGLSGSALPVRLARQRQCRRPGSRVGGSIVRRPPRVAGGALDRSIAHREVERLAAHAQTNRGAAADPTSTHCSGQNGTLSRGVPGSSPCVILCGAPTIRVAAGPVEPELGVGRCGAGPASPLCIWLIAALRAFTALARVVVRRIPDHPVPRALDRMGRPASPCDRWDPLRYIGCTGRRGTSAAWCLGRRRCGAGILTLGRSGGRPPGFGRQPSVGSGAATGVTGPELLVYSCCGVRVIVGDRVLPRKSVDHGFVRGGRE
jgi:hypothetical protein